MKGLRNITNVRQQCNGATRRVRLPIIYGPSKTIGLVAAIIPQQQISIKLAAQKRAFGRFLKSSFYQGGVANCVNNYDDAAVST